MRSAIWAVDRCEFEVDKDLLKPFVCFAPGFPPPAPPDVLKLQFVESGVPEGLSEMIRGLQGGSDPHDLCSIKIASNLIVSLLLGGE